MGIVGPPVASRPAKHRDSQTPRCMHLRRAYRQAKLKTNGVTRLRCASLMLCLLRNVTLGAQLCTGSVCMGLQD